MIPLTLADHKAVIFGDNLTASRNRVLPLLCYRMTVFIEHFQSALAEFVTSYIHSVDDPGVL